MMTIPNAAVNKVLKRLRYPLDVMLTCVHWYAAPAAARFDESFCFEYFPADSTDLRNGRPHAASSGLPGRKPGDPEPHRSHSLRCLRSAPAAATAGLARATGAGHRC